MASMVHLTRVDLGSTLALTVDPPSVTVVDVDDSVTWMGIDLPADASLEVSFERNPPCGPFLVVGPIDETSTLVGRGNVGPDADGRDAYTYRVTLSADGRQWTGGGTVVNLSQQAGLPGNPLGTCKPGEPPGVCIPV